MTLNKRGVDFLIEKKGYALFHSGLQKFLELLQRQRDYGIKIGLGDRIFLEEILRVSGLIKFGQSELSRDEKWPFVNFYSVSKESLEFLKAALYLEIETLKKEKKTSVSKIIQNSIEDRISAIEKDANEGFFQGIELPSIYYEVLPIVKGDEEKQMIEQEYAIPVEIFQHKGVLIDNKQQIKCLVIMPIGKKDTIYYKNNMLVFDRIIKPCVENSGYNIKCYHADLISESGAISRQVIEALRDDDIVIADLRRSNPNVAYELGLRHAFGKRSILVCAAHSDHLFYTTGYRAIPYNIDGISNQDFFQNLIGHVQDIIQNPEKPDNPVADILGRGVSDVKAASDVKIVDKLFFSRKFKGKYTLGELYNFSNEDILNLEILYTQLGTSGTSIVMAKVINTLEDPLFATPSRPTIIKAKEALHIVNFPRITVDVTVTGKIASSGELYKKEFHVPAEV